MTSNEPSLSHTFIVAGEYGIQLTIVGPGGSDELTRLDLITVMPGPVASLEVTPAEISLAAREGMQFTAVAWDEFGNEVSSKIEWAVTEGGGSIDADGRFVADTVAGTFTDAVSASVPANKGGVSAVATVIVEPGPLASVQAEPAAVTLGIGQSQHFNFKALDQFGNEISSVLAAWTADPNIGDISSDGHFSSGTRAGNFPGGIGLDVVQGAARVSFKADVIIQPDPLAYIELQPTFVVVESGVKQEFEAAAFDVHGNEITGLAMLWRATGGVITQRGSFTAGNQSGSYAVTVEVIQEDRSYEARAMVPVPPVWITIDDLRVARATHTATLLPNGQVLIVGGGSPAELYDPTSRTFETVREACNHGGWAQANLLLDGTVLITGGQSDPKCAEVYDPVTKRFTRVGIMNSDHWWHSATRLEDGKVLVSGGLERQSGTEQSHAVAEVYDPATREFAVVGSLNVGRYQHHATLLPTGIVLLANGHRIGRSNCLRHPELYDPLTESFTRISGTGFFRSCGGTATLLEDGNVLITGGGNGGAVTFDASTIRFIPTAGYMAVSSGYKPAVLLPSGEVLITGGHNNTVAVASSEIFDPRTETFFPAGNMSDLRSAHTATLLQDGSVLITGGAFPTYDVSGNQLWTNVSSADLYIPSGRVAN